MRDDSTAAVLADPCDLRHGLRVAALAEALAVRLGWDERRRALLRLAGALHDVGKLTVSMAILGKPGRLTDEEIAEVRRHPAAGVRLVEPILSLRTILPCILYHHERWDGGGYPSGRARTSIPLEARLLAVADAFDAMVSDRPYRRALPRAAALDELDHGAGSQFDPALAEAFVCAWRAGGLLAENGFGSRGSPRPRASSASA